MEIPLPGDDEWKHRDFPIFIRLSIFIRRFQRLQDHGVADTLVKLCERNADERFSRTVQLIPLSIISR
jgi:hypothetical protein